MLALGHGKYPSWTGEVLLDLLLRYSNYAFFFGLSRVTFEGVRAGLIPNYVLKLLFYCSFLFSFQPTIVLNTTREYRHVYVFIFFFIVRDICDSD
jgi:hypothetical protein